MKKLLMTALLVWGWCGLASAQDLEPSDMLRGAMQVIQLLDQGRTSEIWEGAGPAAKKRVSRVDFISQIVKARGALGTSQQRVWVAIGRQIIDDTDPDVAGQYVSVEFESRFSNKPDTSLRELVSFHLDRDKTWRFSGYVLR